MTPVTLDVMLVLPERQRLEAISCSNILSRRMLEQGSSSFFRLGDPFPNEGGKAGKASKDGENSVPCEPHVSLFMLSVDKAEVDDVTRAMQRLARTLPPLTANGKEYRHNPHGAPELYFKKTPAWGELQRAVIALVEPLRRGRLPDLDPSGARIRDVVDNAPRDDPRRQQLLKYGYDEVADEPGLGSEGGGHDRFNPHVTLAWPRDRSSRVPFDGLPPARTFNGELAELAVFGMRAYGTCTRNYGVFPMGSGS